MQYSNFNAIGGMWPRRAALLAMALACVMPASGGSRRSGNYLIVAPPDYASSAHLTQFINHRTAQGFTVSLYNVPTGTSRDTIRNYIVNLWGTANQPEYILIVGETSGSTNSTTTQIPHWTGTGDKGAPTDLPYGAMPGGVSWYIDIPVGRFSILNDDQLGIVVNKTITVESGNFSNPEYVKRGAFLANPDTQGMSEPTHDYVCDQLMAPRGYQGIKIYSSQGGTTADVTNAINTGCLWVVYYGHSGSSGWWDPHFYSDNISGLNNAGLYGLACGWSCNTANYNPTSECSGETWIRALNKGAAAYISASTYIYWGSVSAWQPSTDLEKAFFEAFFLKDIWEVGPAWKDGLYQFLRTYGGWDGNMDHEPPLNTAICHNFFEEFVLFGDPALLLPQPFGFMIDIDPSQQEVCAPPDDQAVYSIDVGSMGGFDENITLSVEGLPSGASANFSANGQIPPFSSTLTVSNLIGAPAGDYNLIVRGNSASMERTKNAALSVSTAPPSATTLLTPENGATGVSLMPELTWQPLGQAQWYDVEVATDNAFTNIVFSATVSAPQCVVDDPALDTLTRYYWHVRGGNPCGDGAFSTPFHFNTLNMIMPAFYDLQNGETGTYTYYDDLYDGEGNNTQALAWLRNGRGDLTDGVKATAHWNSTPAPYVGWKSIDPVITFHFTHEVTLNTVVLYLDDSGGGGGVAAPQDVTLVMGGQTLNFPCVDPPGDGPFPFTLDDLNLTGTTLDLTIADHSSSSSYMMLSEVEFYADVEPCVGDLDGDNDIDIADLAVLLAHYGQTGVNPEDGDLDGDGDVDVSDLAQLLSVYGTNC